MNIKTAFPSNYISAEDLQGQDVPVQIAECRMEAIKQDAGPDKDKPVLYFHGHQRGLVLNVTNALAVASLYGDETDAWGRQWITLYPTQCQFGNRMVDCIRVRPFSPHTPLGQAACRDARLRGDGRNTSPGPAAVRSPDAGSRPRNPRPGNVAGAVLNRRTELRLTK